MNCPLGCLSLVLGQYGYRCMRFGIDLAGKVPERCRQCVEEESK